MTYERLIASILLCALTVTSIGCTSMKTVRPETSPAGGTRLSGIKAGDTVALRTHDGRSARFVVQQVDGDTIIAPDGVRYTSADVAQLKRRSFSVPKTIALAGGIFAGMVILWMAAAVAALDDAWSAR